MRKRELHHNRFTHAFHREKKGTYPQCRASEFSTYAAELLSVSRDAP